MSVPHLDTRVIEGEKVLLFGPFATFSSKFLKNGSLMDLPGSMSTDNALPMVQAGLDNLDLSQYLIGQLMLSQEDRIAELKAYFPQAEAEDWELITAGQRVQIIKNDPEKGGVLQFGTEIVSAADGSIAALLGASPGASTAAPIMLKLLQTTFKQQVETPQWQAKLKAIFPRLWPLAERGRRPDRRNPRHDQRAFAAVRSGDGRGQHRPRLMRSAPGLRGGPATARRLADDMQRYT